jgi:hypothetical protein
MLRPIRTWLKRVKRGQDAAAPTTADVAERASGRTRFRPRKAWWPSRHPRACHASRPTGCDLEPRFGPVARATVAGLMPTPYAGLTLPS